MRIIRLWLNGFRNYHQAVIEFSSGVNYIYGANAQGKSTLLEAISMFAFTKSMLARTESELIPFDDNYYRIEGKFAVGVSDYDISIAYGKKNSKKCIELNASVLQRNVDLIGLFNVVYLYPRVLHELIEQPKGRRKFFDMLISQIDPVYIKSLQSYKSLIAQKNKYMKVSDHMDIGYIDALNMEITRYASAVIWKRIMIMKKLQNHVEKLSQHYFKNNTCLKLTYQEADSEEEVFHRFCELLKEKKRIEMRRRICLVGPHLDFFDMLLNGLSLRIFGSLGQRKLCALLLKMAEVSIIKEVKNEYPVILADDVLLELDEDNIGIFLKVLGETPGQIFISSTHRPGEDLKEAAIFEIKNAKVWPV